MFRYETLKPYCNTLVYSKFQDLTVNKTILKKGLFLGHHIRSTCHLIILGRNVFNITML